MTQIIFALIALIAAWMLAREIYLLRHLNKTKWRLRKLTRNQVVEIIFSKKSASVLAKKYGVSESRITQIKRNGC